MPIASMAFGFATVLINFANCGFYEFETAIVGVSFAFGGLIQLICGILLYHRNDSFTGLIHVTYGLFWWVLICTYIIPPYYGVHVSSEKSMGFFFLVWTVYTAFVVIGNFQNTVAGILAFISLFLFLLMLCITFFTHSSVLQKVAGYFGIVNGCFSFYAGASTAVNEKWGRRILPV